MKRNYRRQQGTARRRQREEQTALAREARARKEFQQFRNKQEVLAELTSILNGR